MKKIRHPSLHSLTDHARQRLWMKGQLTQADQGSLYNSRKRLRSPGSQQLQQRRQREHTRAAQSPANPSGAAGRAGSNANRKSQTPSKFSF